MPMLGGIGLSIGALSARTLPLVAVPPVTAPTAPAYLAKVSKPAYMAQGVQRLVSGYDGPLFEIRRASDGATLNVAPRTDGDFPDYEAIDAWAGGSELTVTRVYDQTGNGRDLVQGSVANQPRYDISLRDGDAVPLIFDGYRRTVTLEKPLRIRKMEVGGLSLNRADYAYFTTIKSQTSYNTNVGWNLRTESGTNRSTVDFSAGLLNGKRYGPKSSIDTIGLTITGNARRYYAQRGETVDPAATSSSNAERFVLGEAVNTPDNIGMFQFFGGVLYSSFVGLPDSDQVVASLNAAHAVPVAYDYRVVFDGDSIMEGTGSIGTRNIVNQIPFAKPADVFNTGVHGQRLATVLAQKELRFAHLDAGPTPRVFFVQAGTNDLGGGDSANALYATTTALVDYLRNTLSFKVVVCTILPRTKEAWSASQESERIAYNNLVRSNVANAHAVLDPAAHPVMGAATAPDDAALYLDQIHPTSLGYRHLAGAPSGPYSGQHTFYAALQAILRTTALGGSYVL